MISKSNQSFLPTKTSTLPLTNHVLNNNHILDKLNQIKQKKKKQVREVTVIQKLIRLEFQSLISITQCKVSSAWIFG